MGLEFKFKAENIILNISENLSRFGMLWFLMNSNWHNIELKIKESENLFGK